MRKFTATCIVALLCQACSKPSSQSTTVPQGEGKVESPTAMPAAGGGVSVTGTVPAAVNGVSTIVVLEPRDAREFPAQTETPVMDQTNRIFAPSLLFVRTGEPVDFRNSDDELHNVNVKEDTTKEQTFNVAIPIGATFEYSFKQDGLYSVHCDIHMMMAAIIVSSSSPFAAVADPSGHFEFDGVPPGAYTAVAYGGAGMLKQPIDVGASGADVVLR
jgi:plastocyanin